MQAYPNAAPTIHPTAAATGTDSPKRLNRKGPFGARIHTPIIMPRHPTSNGLTRDPLITLLMMQARGTVVYKQGLTAFLWLSPEPETAEIFLLPLASGALGLETTAAPLLLGRDTAKVKPKDRHYRFGVTFSRATPTNPICHVVP